MEESKNSWMHEYCKPRFLDADHSRPKAYSTGKASGHIISILSPRLFPATLTNPGVSDRLGYLQLS